MSLLILMEAVDNPPHDFISYIVWPRLIDFFGEEGMQFQYMEIRRRMLLKINRFMHPRDYNAS